MIDHELKPPVIRRPAENMGGNGSDKENPLALLARLIARYDAAKLARGNSGDALRNDE